MKVSDEIAGSGYESRSISQRYGSADPDPYQNFMDPQQCGSVNGLALLDPDQNRIPITDLIRICLWVIFALLDPDMDPGTPSNQDTDPDPDPRQWLF